ncbi:MAG: ABC transporter substrate-binding protein [Demequina sp.]|uniref:ABC transporter substrate-binding protein n=1 Tax=Demequina sp. TaxID=2050685 RepID=UPI003A897427
MTAHGSRRRSAAVAFTTLALGALTLAGCSTDADPENSASADAPAASGEAITIQYVHRLPDGEGMTKVADLAAEWNAANPDVQVETTKFDGQAGELVAKLETDISAGVGPCLAQLDYSEVPSMYVRGLTADVAEYADQYRDNFSGAFSMMTVGDAVVGLPQDTGPLVYYYNKAEFDRLGLSVPTTIDEFKATAATAADEGKYIGAFEPDEAKFWLSGQAAAAGAQWYSAGDDGWVVDADSDASAVVADLWQTMIDGDDVLVLERWSDAFPAALNDQSLIGTIGAAWEAPLLADAMAGTDNEGQWAVAQLPDFGAGALTGPDGGSGVAVMSGCEYPEQALEVANWFNTQIDALVSQGLVVAAIGEMTTPDSIAAFYGGQDVNAELAKANGALSADFTYAPGFATVGDSMAVAAAAAGSGDGTVADVFSAAQEQSITTLTDLGLPVQQ